MAGWTGFHNLRHLLIAFGWAWLASAARQPGTALLLQTLIWRGVPLAEGLNLTVSQILSGGIMTTLLISTPLYVWGRALERGRRA